MQAREIAFTFASFQLGLGNRATLAMLGDDFTQASLGYSRHTIVTTGPLTTLADLRQRAMTNNQDRAAHYTTNQDAMRGSILARLLGLEGLTQILAQTPTLGAHQERILIASSELYFLPIIKDLDRILSPFFTHLMLVIADVAPKSTALKIIKHSQKNRMPITPIVFARSTSSSLTADGVPNILVAPILNPRATRLGQETINVIKEAGTGLDKQSRAEFESTMSSSPHPLHLMRSNGRIGNSSPLSLSTYYRFLQQHQLGIVGTHASEMIGTVANNLPKELILATARGSHEQVNADWIARFYEEGSPVSKRSTRHLQKRSSSQSEISDEIGHANPMAAISSFIRKN